MIKATRSIPQTPATMCLTNFSWPGTSMMPIRIPLGRSKKVNPSSVVIPLSFSSFSRSVSTPVRALTREVFPWSMCPAVPSITCFITLPQEESVYLLLKDNKKHSIFQFHSFSPVRFHSFAPKNGDNRQSHQERQGSERD